VDTQAIASLDELQDLLRQNTCWANGKNFSIDHLHATGANSRWSYENIFGIYMANPGYAWMAAWMAATDRTKIRKRSITYHRPVIDDHLGRISVCSSEENVLRDHDAFLYLVDPTKYSSLRQIDVSLLYGVEKIDALLHEGFMERVWVKRETRQMNYFAKFTNPAVVLVDAWQLALVNVDIILPDREIVIPHTVIAEMQQRIGRFSHESSENYIRD